LPQVIDQKWEAWLPTSVSFTTIELLARMDARLWEATWSLPQAGYLSRSATETCLTRFKSRDL